MNYIFKTLPIILLIFAKSMLFGQCSDKFPYWLEGQWAVQPHESGTIEEWVRDGEHTMKAEIFKLYGDDRLVFDNMTIKCHNEEVIMELNAIMGKYKVKAGFKLSEQTEDFMVFENPVTDYPNKISYRKVGNDTVVVNVSGRSPEISSMDAELVRIKKD